MVHTTGRKTFKKGEMLIHEGEQGDSAYIIEKGSVEVLVAREGKLIQIGTRSDGSIVGEMAMIDDKPRTASVRAVEDCEVLEISRDDFARRIESSDPILRMVMQVILTRYRDMLSRSQLVVKVPPPGFIKAEDLEKDDKVVDVAVNTLKVYNELHDAIKNHELKLFYQPIIDLRTGKIAGFEALARWFHPEKGMISPGIFIPVAEESGLIVDVSRWALNEACESINILSKEVNSTSCMMDEPLFISVNFSVHDFSDKDFFSHVEKIMNKNKTKPKQIHLEITESLLVEQPEIAREGLEKCQDFGIEVSIDDFGTGYSSLSYLHFFPINTLKIDQSFVRLMLEQENNYQLVKSIIALAKNLNMSVIAEGVEHREEAAVLKSLGCESCQGFWFARPQPLEDAVEFIRNWCPPDVDFRKDL